MFIERKEAERVLERIGAPTYAIHGLAYVKSVPLVAEKHGWWIEKQEPLTWCEDDVDVFWECSACGIRNFVESPYCPNCGAKMDGGNE